MEGKLAKTLTIGSKPIMEVLGSIDLGAIDDKRLESTRMKNEAFAKNQKMKMKKIATIMDQEEESSSS